MHRIKSQASLIPMPILTKLYYYAWCNLFRLHNTEVSETAELILLALWWTQYLNRLSFAKDRTVVAPPNEWPTIATLFKSSLPLKKDKGDTIYELALFLLSNRGNHSTKKQSIFFTDLMSHELQCKQIWNFEIHWLDCFSRKHNSSIIQSTAIYLLNGFIPPSNKWCHWID